ncbi:hypothetical protein ARMGADRAFT_1035603 [Armillaria gallica]|uniref:Uncharacterized protein n=1 Tax=Armillaria gallica TaxID=47427 RepID=A0A2H3CTR9_ARMGA|nr:hypothetical protein ARMGADRAFT_1035603 [Armillaria gallica]
MRGEWLGLDIMPAAAAASSFSVSETKSFTHDTCPPGSTRIWFTITAQDCVPEVNDGIGFTHEETLVNAGYITAFSVLWQTKIEEVLLVISVPETFACLPQELPVHRRSGLEKRKLILRHNVPRPSRLYGVANSTHDLFADNIEGLVKRKRRLRIPQAACVPVSIFYRKHKDSDAFSVFNGSELLQETRSEELRICQGISRN